MLDASPSGIPFLAAFISSSLSASSTEMLITNQFRRAIIKVPRHESEKAKTADAVAKRNSLS
jgi:hypothetical protein